MPKLAHNKRARFDYEILETYEAGIVLTGAEVKSVRQKNISLKGAYATINNTGPEHSPEAWLINAHISAYQPAGPQPDYDPTRSRKLLLHKKEVQRLIGKKNERGLTLLPLSFYTKKSRIKVGLGLGKGKKKFDKREDIKKKDDKRRMQRALKE
ncbi:MAG: SsrA-binding protein SmpB [Parcubacteria group bacterium]